MVVRLFQYQLGECCQDVFVRNIPSCHISKVTALRNQSVISFTLFRRLADDRWNLVFMPQLSHTSVDPTACSRVLGGKWALIARGNGTALQGGFYCSQRQLTWLLSSERLLWKETLYLAAQWAPRWVWTVRGCIPLQCQKEVCVCVWDCCWDATDALSLIAWPCRVPSTCSGK